MSKMESKLPTYAKLVSLCNGDKSKANRIYDELVRRYYNTVSVFDGIYVNPESVEFEPTQPVYSSVGTQTSNVSRALNAQFYLVRLNKENYLSNSKLYEERDQVKNYSIGDVVSGYPNLDTVRKDYLDMTEEMYASKKLLDSKSIGDEIDNLLGNSDDAAPVLAGVQIPMDILKMFAVEIKSMSMVNRDLQYLEEDMRTQYKRLASIADVRLDLTYLDTYESEIFTVALCMHPIMGISAIAAYHAGMFAQVGAKYVKIAQSAKPDEVPRMWNIRMSSKNSLYSPDFTKTNLRAETAELVAALSTAMRNRSVPPVQSDVKVRLEKWIKLFDETVGGNYSEQELADKWADWHMLTLKVTRSAQVEILQKWRENVIGSVFPSGLAFIDNSIEHMINSVKTIGTVNFNISATMFLNILGTFYKTSLTKRCNRKLAQGAFIDVTKNMKFMKSFQKAVQEENGKNDDIEWEDLRPLVSSYAKFVNAPTAADRQLALLDIKILAGRLSDYTTLREESQVGPIRLDRFNLRESPLDVNVFRHAFPASVWEKNEKRCVASAVILYLRSCNLFGAELGKWLQGPQQAATYTTSHLADLVYTGTLYVEKKVSTIAQRLRNFVDSARGVFEQGKYADDLQYADEYMLDFAIGKSPMFPMKGELVEISKEIDRYLLYLGLPVRISRTFAQYETLMPFVAKTDSVFDRRRVVKSRPVFDLNHWQMAPWLAVYHRFHLAESIGHDNLGYPVIVGIEKWIHGVAVAQVNEFAVMSVGVKTSWDIWTKLQFAMLGKLAITSRTSFSGTLDILVKDPRVWAFLHVAKNMPMLATRLSMGVQLDTRVNATEAVEFVDKTSKTLLKIYRDGRGYWKQEWPTDETADNFTELITDLSVLDKLGPAVQVSRDASYAAVLAMTGTVKTVDQQESFDFLCLAAARPDICEKWARFMVGKITLFDFLVPEEWVATRSARTKFEWAMQEAEVYWEQFSVHHQKEDGVDKDDLIGTGSDDDDGDSYADEDSEEDEPVGDVIEISDDDEN